MFNFVALAKLGILFSQRYFLIPALSVFSTIDRMRTFFPIVFCLFVCAALPFVVGAQGIFYTDCSDKTICFPFNQCGQTNVNITAEATTTCGSPTLNFTYKIDFGNNGSVDIQDAGATINTDFPPGLSKITWRVTNACGQAATCTQVLTVQDCQSPNFICRNGVTQSLDNNCSININAQQFVLSVSDNCTPVPNLVYGIRKAGTGTGFPPHDTINYYSCDQGTNIVEVFVKDAKGNINQCANYVLVQNNAGLCPCIEESKINLTGCARRAGDVKLNSYRVNAKILGTASGQPVSTQKTVNSTDSCFTLKFDALPLNLNASVTIRASRIDDITAGVTPYDLVLISRHILNFEPFTSFYQTLAADVNRSHTITTFDIVEIRKTLLGIVDTFPAVPVWQFLRPVPDPSDLIAFPFLKDTFLLNYSNLVGETSATGFNFIGVKSGDIDRTTSFTGDELEERNGEPFVLTTADKWLEAGTEFSVPIHLSGVADLTAWQSSFWLDNRFASLLAVEGISAENYAVLPDGEIKVIWLDDNVGAARHFSKNDAVLFVKIKVVQPAKLSQILTADPLEAVTADAYKHPLVFRFSDDQPSATVNEQVFPPVPNPFADHVEWPITVSASTIAQLAVHDVSGRLVLDQFFNLVPGFQSLMLDGISFPANGWYFWRLSLGEITYSGKLFRQ